MLEPSGDIRVERTEGGGVKITIPRRPKRRSRWRAMADVALLLVGAGIFWAAHRAGVALGRWIGVAAMLAGAGMTVRSSLDRRHHPERLIFVENRQLRVTARRGTREKSLSFAGESIREVWVRLTGSVRAMRHQKLGDLCLTLDCGREVRILHNYRERTLKRIARELDAALGLGQR